MKNQKLFLLLSLLCLSSVFAQIKITGKVLDETGLPLPGATIIEFNTQNGTTTDFDGKFILNTKSSNGKIVVSFLGYQNKELTYSPAIKTFNNVQLSLSSEVLNEVVVVGYGSQKKEDLSTAIAVAKVNENMKSRPMKNIESLLQGQLAGVTIQTNGGNPLQGSSVSIRGVGSYQNNGALFVVDGVPNAPFNVEDVETVSVLKDGASAAIYGAYVGAGGVVVVTTKKAKKGIHLSLNSSTGIANVVNLPTALTQEQYFKVMEDAYDANGKNYPDFFSNPYFRETRTDWFKEIFRPANIDHHAISISGGSDKVKALASFSYDNNEGVLINTYKETIGAMLKLDFDASKWLRLSERLSYKNTNGQGNVNTSSHEGVINEALVYPRSSTRYDINPDGTQVLNEFGDPAYNGTVPHHLKDDTSAYGNLRNPFATLDRLREHNPKNRIFSTTTVEVEPIKNLIFKSDYTFGINLERYENFKKKVTEVGRTNLANYRTISNTYHKEWLSENTVSYKRNFNKHRFDALLGYTALYKQDRHNSITMTGFDSENEYQTILTQGSEVFGEPYESISEESRASFLSRLNYSFADRYFLTVSARRDETSKLLINRADWFRAASLAWKVSSESFFDSMKETISLLKLRASWGEIANVDAVPRTGVTTADLKDSDWVSYFGIGGKNGVKGSFQKSEINPLLRWENTSQLDFGIDVELFKSLEVTADYFEKTTKDLITRGQSNPVSGLEAAYINDGKNVIKGFELGIKYNKKYDNFNYNVYGNFSKMSSEVVQLDQNFIDHGYERSPYSSALRSTLGSEWLSYYVIKTDGIFQTQEEINKHVFVDPVTGSKKLIQPNAQPGDVKFVDNNNDGKITDEDKDYVGSYMPEITYTLGANFNYKNFDLGFNFQGVANSKILNIAKSYEIGGNNQESNFSTRVLNSWTPTNTNTNLPRFSVLSDPNKNLGWLSDLFIEDGSYLRLKNITFGYTVPSSVIQKLGLENGKLRIYFNAENVFTITDYSGIDPEVGNNGVDAGQYPVSRTLSLGLNFNF